MSSPLIFTTTDGRTLPYIPVTIAALDAILETCEQPREDDRRRSYPHALATYMALLTIANEHRATRAPVTQKELARRGGMSRTAVQSALSDLQAARVLIVVEQRHGPARVENEYVVVEPGATDSTPARTASDPRSHSEQNACARPSHPSDARAIRTEEEEREEARSRAQSPSPITYGRKKVPPHITEMAEHLLSVFNACTGRSLGARKHTGGASEHLSQIVGVVLDRPDVPVGDWERAVRNTVANPPSWVQGPVQLGAVFGPRAVEYALANTGQPVVSSNGGGRRLSKGERQGEQIRKLLRASGELP